MNSKNLLSWVILATWIFAWCSNNNEIKEINEPLTDSIAVIKDSVKETLIETINQDIHKFRKKYIRHSKIPLLNEDNIAELTLKEEDKDSINNRRTKLINMYEEWFEDEDEMKKYSEQNNDYKYYNWKFISDDFEREDNYKTQDYDPDEDYLFFRIIK